MMHKIGVKDFPTKEQALEFTEEVNYGFYEDYEIYGFSAIERAVKYSDTGLTVENVLYMLLYPDDVDGAYNLGWYEKGWYNDPSVEF